MLLKLYKTPFKEPFCEDKVRILFENIEEDDSKRKTIDFYLYVWIKDFKYLSGFQAVLNEEFVCEFKIPYDIKFIKIISKPIKRSTAHTLTLQEKNKFIESIKNFKGQFFCELLKKIEQIILGEKKDKVELTKDEIDLLKELLDKNKKDILI
jgi:hypothetical protein